MKVLFISNFYKTIFFHGVAQHLEKMGHEVFWISVSYEWTTWLKNNGVAGENILDITRNGKEWSKPNFDDLEELHSLEKLNKWTIKDMILMDRLLREQPFYDSLAYLESCRNYITCFLKKNNMKIVFSEKTHAVELLTSQICKSLDILTYAPHTIRIPDGRFGFFGGHLQSKLEQLREPCRNDEIAAEKFYETFLNKKPQPRYFHLNNNLPKVEFNWAYKMFQHIGRGKSDPYDKTRPSVQHLIKLRLQQVINKRLYLFTKPYEDIENIGQRPYVLYTLHKQPEASIDVLGSYFSNQIELIKALSRSLPINYMLYVKEHSNAIGDRAMSFYDEVSKIPGVKLISPFADIHTLLQRAKLVVTISGTASYEAALLGTPSATIVPMFFGEILSLNGLNPYHRAFDEITQLLSDASDKINRRELILRFLTCLMSQSYPGVISDPRSDSYCMSQENLANVAGGMNALIKTLT